MEHDNKKKVETPADGVKFPKLTSKKTEPSEWKTDRIRAERRARLAEMKGKDGGKKPIRTRTVWRRVVAIVVAAAILLAAGVWVLFRFGVPQRSVNALSIDSEKVTASEMNMITGLHAMNIFQIGLIFTPENQAMLKEMPAESNHTYLDMVIDSAISELRMNKTLNRAMTDAGFELTEDDKAMLEANVAELPIQFAQAAEQSGASLPIFLEYSFGPGVSMEDLENYYRESFAVNAFITDHYNNVEVTEDELEAYYGENQNQLDMVNYYLAEFTADYAEDADEETVQAAIDAAADTAKSMLEELDDADNFYDLAYEFASDEQKAALDRNPGSVYHQFELYSDPQTPSAVKTWLFDEARSEGEMAVVDGTSSSYVVLFESRDRANVSDYSVRHILIRVDRDTASDKEIELAKTEAENILKSYEDGEQTETAFGELAMQHSADGNAQQGGIYEDVPPGQMVPEFENWALNPERTAGDTTIVQSQFGFHIMYFVSHGDTPYWETMARASLANDETVAWRDDMVSAATVEGSSFGMKMVGKTNIFDILFGHSYDPAEHSH